MSNKKGEANTRLFPFYRNGMGGEEMLREHKYYAEHQEDVKKGTYKPLWQQEREQAEKKNR